MSINRPVFLISAGLVGLFVFAGSVQPEATGTVLKVVQDFIVSKLGWLYTVSVTFFLLFVIWLPLSRFGGVRLGADDEKPEFGRTSWFAMLFSAGMGIGLMFFSVAEPLQHFSNPVTGEAGDWAQARRAMGITFFHWGFHAWATYIVIGLAMAYFAHRRGLPLTARSMLQPLLGERTNGVLGHAIDVLAVFGTLFGVATSLGLGVQQINAGLKHIGLIDVSLPNQLLLITGITAVATVSVVTGVKAGIRLLSELNLSLGLLLLLFVFVAGPTAFLLEFLIECLIQYPVTVYEMTWHGDSVTGPEWQKAWTLFFWAWWISWAPFVGMFVARISRGRTVREFVLGVLLVPAVLTLLWLAVFGGTALRMELTSEAGLVEAAMNNMPTTLYVMLEHLPWPAVTSALATVVIATYFVTSSDSASLVIDIITAGGDPDPPIRQRVFWAVTEGVVAMVLLITGGLVALQTAAVATGLPLCVLMWFVCWSLLKALRSEAGDSTG